MTRRRTSSGVRWARRVAAAVALMPVVLLGAAGPVWAFGADGSGRLGQTPPVLSWIALADSRGVSIWNYELSLDRGEVTSPDRFFWSAVTDGAWGAYRSWCALALWFLDWVMSFDWLQAAIAAPLLTTGDAAAPRAAPPRRLRGRLGTVGRSGGAADVEQFRYLLGQLAAAAAEVHSRDQLGPMRGCCTSNHRSSHRP